MKKQLKEILNNCPLSAKWLNMREWQKEKFSTVFEMCENENIKIHNRNQKGCSGLLKIYYDYGQMRVIRFSSISNIEADLVNLYAQKCLYLGDKFKITHRLRNYSN